MPTAVLITFKLPRKEKNISNAEASKVYRKLYGYENQSYYGKYQSTVPGMLDEIPSIRYFNSVIIVRKEDASEVISFLEDNKAEVLSWEVSITDEEEAEVLGFD